MSTHVTPPGPTRVPFGGLERSLHHGTTFGPVPSRRFGRSLGVNNIPPKVCTYSCAYCQVGRTVQMRCDRRPFYGAASVGADVRRRVAEARRTGVPMDFITFAPDGEPTLDSELGGAIRRLRPLGVPIAVITNGSLLSLSAVREALAAADHVSIKVDAVRTDTWRRVDRPHRCLDLDTILDGMRRFRASFKGVVTTETMLLDGVNDSEEELRHTAAFIGELNPRTAYLSVPTRPPAEAWARAPEESVVARAYEVFRAFHPAVELLVGYEGDAFASTGDLVSDLLSITAVHPMREVAVRRLLTQASQPWRVVDELLGSGLLTEVRYGPHRYYLRPAVRPTVHRR